MHLKIIFDSEHKFQKRAGLTWQHLLCTYLKSQCAQFRAGDEDFQSKKQRTRNKRADQDKSDSYRSSNIDDVFLLLLLRTAPFGPGSFGGIQLLHLLLLLLFNAVIPASLYSPGSSPPQGPVPGLSEQEASAEGGPGPGPPLAADPLRSRLPADLQRGDVHLHRSV